jgi:hypothetical protein
VDELRRDSDNPDHDDRPEYDVPRVADADTATARRRMEPRDRVDYAADMERIVARQAQVEAVRGFDPRRANLPEISEKDAAAYLDAHCAERPWLQAARGCEPEVQRVFAAIDQGGGHPHIRHEGWTTEEMNQRRVAYLEDPAQLDRAKQQAGIDGLRSPEGRHHCGEIASRFITPEAFAAAYARGIEHPEVRAALDTAFAGKKPPSPVEVPISDLLGTGGHRDCAGWQLQPVNGSMDVARERRAAWLDARADHCEPDVPEPAVRPVGTFEGGTVVFRFRSTSAQDGYEINTMYANPPRDEQKGIHGERLLLAAASRWAICDADQAGRYVLPSRGV